MVQNLFAYFGLFNNLETALMNFTRILTPRGAACFINVMGRGGASKGLKFFLLLQSKTLSKNGKF